MLCSWLWRADRANFCGRDERLIPNPGVELLDFDGDGLPATEADARFLYRWILNMPGSTVLELD